MGNATIFAGSKIKALKSTLNLNGGADVISSTTDPTSVAVSAEPGSLLLNTTSGKLYRKNDSGSSTNWSEVGSGGAGINYITNPNAATNLTGWQLYQNAAQATPQDGIGGTPLLLFTRSTTTPLRGSADFNLAKGNLNRQGEGVSTDFTIDLADQAKPLEISFDYEFLSGSTYADGDLTIYIIADPGVSNTLIQPAGFRIMAATVGTKMKAKATFQTLATGQTYRLCFHVATTSTQSYTIAFDNVVVGPQVTNIGPAVNDWTSFTPTTTWNSTASTNSGMWRRVGDSLQINGNLVLSGTPPAGNFVVTLPFGLQIDSAKIPTGSLQSVGTLASDDFLTGFHLGAAVVSSANTITFVGDDGAGATSPTVPFTFGVNDSLKYNFTVPVTGWSSNTVMSNDTDTRVVAAKISSATARTINNTSPTIIYETTDYDTHGAYNAATGAYTVPVSGVYRVSGGITTAGATQSPSFLTALFLFKGSTHVGTIAADRAETTALTLRSATGSTTVSVNAGDVLTVRGYSDAAATLAPGAATQNSISFERLSGPAQVAASETVAMAKGSSVVRSVPVAGAYIDFDNTAGFTDTHNAWRAGSGYVAGTGAWSVQPAYVVPVSGIYSVSVRMIFGSTAGFKQLFIHRNGSVFASTADDNTYAGNFPLVLHGQIRCNAGDLLQVLFAPQNAQNAPSTVSNFWSGIEISRIGN